MEKDIKSLILDHSFWSNVKHVNIYEPLYTIIHLVYKKFYPTMPILYELMQKTKENLSQQKGIKWVLWIKNIQWDMLLHPLDKVGE